MEHGYEDCRLLCFLLLALGGRRRIRCTQREIAEKTGLSQQSVSRLLRELETRGLISRIVKGRGEYIEVTDRGLKALERLEALARNVLEGDRNTIVLEGVIVDGLGEGRYYMSLPYYVKAIEKITGFRAYPGTLNVRLIGESVWRRRELDAHEGLRIPGFRDEKRVYGGAKLFPARINGFEPAAIVMPERTSHPSDVVEIIAPVYLRGELGLKTGSRVVIEVRIPG